MNKKKELTNAEIERQDFVDDNINEMLTRILPQSMFAELDIEQHGEMLFELQCAIRDTIAMTIEMNEEQEYEFYPFLEWEGGENDEV